MAWNYQEIKFYYIDVQMFTSTRMKSASVMKFVYICLNFTVTCGVRPLFPYSHAFLMVGFVFKSFLQPF